MLLLASAQAEAVPASVNHKFLAHRQPQSTGDNSQSSSDSIKLCKYLDDKVLQRRMKHRSFVITNSNNINEFSKVKSLKSSHERQVRSIEHSIINDLNNFAGYDKTKTRRNISLDNSFRENVVNNEESLSVRVENISQATLASSDVKSNVQKDSSDKIYLHVNGETMCFYYIYFFSCEV